MMSRLDPDTNLTRNTLAAAAAIGGGANSVSLLPHTMPVGLPESAARRMALATQTVMKREVQLRPISNPTPAPDLQNQLIASLCETAWEEFRRIENEGGILHSLVDGRLQERVLEARQARIETVRGGQNVIVGATVFEPPVPVSHRRSTSPVKPLPEDGTVFCEKLSPRRLEEDVVGIVRSGADPSHPPLPAGHLPLKGEIDLVIASRNRPRCWRTRHVRDLPP